MSDFRPPQRKKNALDNRKLNLSSPTPGHQGKFANLIWGLYSNNPRLTVYTGDPEDQGADKGYGKITANLDGPVFFGFLELLRQAIDSQEPEFKAKIENKNFTFFGGKRSDKPAVVSELWVGKDKDGVIWMSVTAQNRPKIKFNFILSDFHNLMHGDGTPFTKAEISKICANGYISMLKNMMSNLMVNEYVEPPPRDPPGGNKGGYGGNRGGGGGGYGGNRGGSGGGGSPEVTTDDDMPF